MIDEKIIRDNYSGMTDAQLLNLAQNEGRELTAEALVFLREEFLRRKLDTGVFEILKDGTPVFDAAVAEKATGITRNDFMKSIWDAVLLQKEAGMPDEEIQQRLIAKGLAEEQAHVIVETIEQQTKKILDMHTGSVLKGMGIGVTGLAIVCWKYSTVVSGGVYGLAWVAVVAGIFISFKGVASKSRYKTILANIEAERIIAAQTVNNFPPSTNTTENGHAVTTAS